MIEFSSQVFRVGVYDEKKMTKTKELTEASALVGLLLATTLHVWVAHVADSLKQSAREKKISGQCRRKVIPSTRIPSDWK